MGPTWPFLLTFESRVERHSMATCIRLSTDPWVWGITNIESYGGILLYFCEIGNMKKYLTLVYMTPVNGYKLDKYGSYQ